jgi:dolichol-phosphate mannosyltransferase
MASMPDTRDHTRQLRLLSVVVPIYNEEETLLELHARIAQALGELPFELVLVDDGSRDRTPELLTLITARDERVRVIRLSRNFGHQAALTAGLEHARGDAIVSVDGDLQDPPEVILEMLDRWREGYDVITGIRHHRAGEPRWRLAAIRLFYALFARIAQLKEYEGNAGDFRMFSREALDALNSLPERNRYVRGLASWIGFRQTAVVYERDARFAGTSKYPLARLISLAADGVLSFSLVPLRMAALLGAIFSVLALLAVPLVIVLRLTGVYVVPGTASIHILVLFLGGIQLVTLGIIGEYLGRNYDETKRRPLYLVKVSERPDGGTNTS